MMCFTVLILMMVFVRFVIFVNLSVHTSVRCRNTDSSGSCFRSYIGPKLPLVPRVDTRSARKISIADAERYAQEASTDGSTACFDATKAPGVAHG